MSANEREIGRALRYVKQGPVYNFNACDQPATGAKKIILQLPPWSVPGVGKAINLIVRGAIGAAAPCQDQG
jgi:hypothetical protein